MKQERTRVFPPLIPITALVIAWIMDGSVEAVAWEPGPWRWGGLVVAMAGGALLTWAVVHQYRRGTDPNPFGKTSRLVTDGPYRFSRNPVYLADVIIQAGLGAFFAWEWALLLLPVTWLALRFLVIRNEERHLLALFGDEYREYCRKVRRWK